MPRRYYSSIAQRTTLSADITASQTSVTVAAVTGFPSSFPFTIIVDQDTVNEEVMEVSSRSGTTLTVVRGVDGTTGVSHTAGATVNHGVSARDFDEPNAFINGTDFVSTTGGSTITNSASATVAFTIQGASGQTANLLNARNSDDSARFVVAQNGIVGITSTSTPQTAMGIAFYSANANARIVNMEKGRGTEASPAVVQDGDDLGVIQFRGYSGTASAFVNAAQIRAQVDGTPDSGGDTSDMPGRLVFFTTPDGSATATERMRITSDGKVGIGTTTPTVALDVKQNIQVVGTTGTVSFSCIGDGAASSIVGTRYSTDANAAQFFFFKYRGSASSPSVVANGDPIGLLRWYGYDGSNTVEAARIGAAVDGTPGTNDMPGRLTFHTTPDGSATLAEAMRINNGQELLIGYTADNGAYKLQVNSQIFATSATIATSDGRYKDNVETLDGGWDMIKALRPVAFDWKPQQDVVDSEGNLVREAHNFPDGRQIGFIAQEVQEALADHPWISNLIKENRRPEVVAEDGTVAPAETFYGIAEGNLIAVLCSALQEAQSRIESLEARLDSAGL